MTNERVAELLHNLVCDANHTDGCDWHYHSWDSYHDLSARAKYLKWVANLLKKGSTLDEIDYLIARIRNARLDVQDLMLVLKRTEP